MGDNQIQEDCLESGVEKWTNCLQVLLCQIGEGTKLKVVTEDGGVHVLEYTSSIVDTYFRGMPLDEEMSKRYKGCLRVTESTNPNLVGGEGYLAGGVRLGSPFYLRAGIYTTFFGNVSGIRGINVREDTVTGETFEVLEKYFGDVLENSEAAVAETQMEVKDGVGSILKVLMMPVSCRECGRTTLARDADEACDSYRGVHKDPIRFYAIVSAAIDCFYREIRAGKKVKFTKKQLIEIGRVLGEFISNYDVDTGKGMVASGDTEFEVKSFFGKKTRFEVHVTSSPYNGMVKRFSIREVEVSTP